MPSEPVAASLPTEARRLHPMSWLFLVLDQLKAFAIPLVLLLVTGRGNRNELVGLVGIVGLGVLAVVRYLTFRYQLGADGVVLTSGVFERTAA